MPPEELWQSFFDPDSILRKLGLDARYRLALEFGCGYGTFTIPTAQMIGDRVYAIDIDPEMIAITKSKADAAGLHNIEFMQRDFITEGSGLKAEQ